MTLRSPRAGATASGLLLLLACGGDSGSRSAAAAVTDTLPSGATRTTSAAPTGWRTPAEGWTFTETARYGGGEGTGELIEPGDLGVDAAGRLYAVDRKPAVIKVYDSAGTFLHTIGREGAGPGEFRVAFMAVRGDRVVVHDPMQSRTTVFDTSGTYLTSWKSSCCYWSQIAIDRGGRVYVPSMPPPDSANKNPGRVYVRYRLSGELVDTVVVPDRGGEVKQWMFSSKGKDGKTHGMMSTPVPYTPNLVATFHGDSGFQVGWTGSYAVYRSYRGRDTARVIAREWTAEALPPGLREARVAEIVKNAKDMVGEAAARSVARLEDVPATAPAFTDLVVDDDGYLWARQLVGSDSTGTRFDLFAPGGEWLGALRVPVEVPEYTGHLIARNSFYTVTDGDDGRPVVIRYRLGRTGPARPQ